MGDLHTHGMIALTVMELLQTEGPQNEQNKPRDNVWFFELGNFLTDLSQLRDPYAWVAAKSVVWRESRKQHWAWTLKWLPKLDMYLDELLGSNSVHGQLPQFLMEFAYLIGNEKFVGKKLVPAEEYDRIFRSLEHYRKEYKGFTQYWPHEHLDHPPWPHGNKIGYRFQSEVDRHTCADPLQGKRKVYAQLDLQVECCAELLTVVEHKYRDLCAKPDNQLNQQLRNEVLALYGHVSHMVEDFWFHSNFVDKSWSRMYNKPLPGDDNTPHWNRIWLRRLRSPLGTDATNQALSTTQSDFLDLVYTGNFGGDDVFFTLKDALKTFQEKHDITQEPWFVLLPRDMQYVFKFIFDDNARRPFFEKNEKGEYKNTQQREDFFRRLRNTVNNIDQIMADASQFPGGMRLHPNSVKALKKMCAIDKQVYDKYTCWWKALGVPDQINGPFAFMIELLGQADARELESDTKAAELDKLATDVPLSKMRTKGGSDDYLGEAICPTYNGAARETIGSHSLINKDNDHKKPLFQQAFNIATLLSCYIAEVMLRQVQQDKLATARFTEQAEQQSEHGAQNVIKKPRYVDWLHLLRHFICHPDETEKTWHVAAMANPKAPTEHTLKYIDSATAQERMKLVRRDHLEEMYKSIASAAESEWQVVKTQ
jgi:hypothetical protein